MMGSDRNFENGSSRCRSLIEAGLAELFESTYPSYRARSILLIIDELCYVRRHKQKSHFSLLEGALHATRRFFLVSRDRVYLALPS
jgi:hypothetical protein